MRRRLLLASLLAAAVAAGPLAAETEEPDLDPEAVRVLNAMAETLAGAEALSVVADVAFDVVQDDGQVLEFGSVRRMTIRRPDRFAAMLVPGFD